MIATREKAQGFLDLHHGPNILVLPNAWDVASAVLLSRQRFPAIATTSAGIGFSRGYVDGESIPREEEPSPTSGLVTGPISTRMTRPQTRQDYDAPRVEAKSGCSSWAPMNRYLPGGVGKRSRCHYDACTVGGQPIGDSPSPQGDRNAHILATSDCPNQNLTTP
jgi:hypothetical protein